MRAGFRTLLFSSSLVAVFASVSHAQGPDTLWTRTYERAAANQLDAAFAVAEVQGGDFVLVGQSSGLGLLLVRTTSNGDSLWTRTYGLGSSFAGYDVAALPSGGFLLVGSIYGYNWDTFEYWWGTSYWKTDALGTPVAQTTWPVDIGEDMARSIEPVTAGGYIVTGYTGTRGTGGPDVEALRLDGDGNLVWQKQYGGAGEQEGFAGLEAHDGGFVFAGRTLNPTQAYMVKTSASGSFEWSRSFGGASYDDAQAICRTPDGGYLLAGATESFGAGAKDAYLVKTNGAGMLQWSKTYGGSGSDEAMSLVPLAAGGYLFSGTTGSFGDANGDVWVVAIDDTGHVDWSAVYGTLAMDAGDDVIVTANGDYAVAGCLRSFPGPAYDAEALLARHRPGISSDVPGFDLTDGLLSPWSIRSYPNPSGDLTTLSFTVAVPAVVELRVMDARGRLVRSLGTAERRAVGTYRSTWDGRDEEGHRVPNGQYFLTLRTSAGLASHKITILR